MDSTRTNDGSELRRTHPRSRSGERGATAIEYALIATLIFIVIVGAVATVGTNVQGPFNTAANAL